MRAATWREPPKPAAKHEEFPSCASTAHTAPNASSRKATHFAMRRPVAGLSCRGWAGGTNLCGWRSPLQAATEAAFGVVVGSWSVLRDSCEERDSRDPNPARRRAQAPGARGGTPPRARSRTQSDQGLTANSRQAKGPPPDGPFSVGSGQMTQIRRLITSAEGGTPPGARARSGHVGAGQERERPGQRLAPERDLDLLLGRWAFACDEVGKKNVPLLADRPVSRRVSAGRSLSHRCHSRETPHLAPSSARL